MQLKHIFPLLALLSLLALIGCSYRRPGDRRPDFRRTTITLTHPVAGSIQDETTFPATAAYLHKSAVTAPIDGYITEGNVAVGEHVAAGQALYHIESREQHALQSGEAQPLTASRNGIVLDVAALAGSYVSAGETLCTIADAASLVFEISLPSEFASLITHNSSLGTHCTLLFPDGTRHAATIGSSLATMDAASQTLTLLARPTSPLASPVPEGLRAQAKLTTKRQSTGSSLLLPRAAVQSNESLTEHWVMKLRATDSTVVRVPVTLGRSDGERVEVLIPATSSQSPTLTPADRVVLTGGYGLEDGARVKY